ncbi:MAG TPA: alpha-E domain-containing protein [Bryobacteraceae bacterium]|nr:alpha-E domain-containing protein [Bryobacteraceae bacterium]
MLSRVADSLYWMSRYLERADHCSRVLEANYNLLLNPSKPSREQRWHRISASLGLTGDLGSADPQTSLVRLIAEPRLASSIVSCIAVARENASQVREQISSEMWERLNQLYHEITQNSMQMTVDSEPLRLITLFREGTYRFQGVTDSTINHGEGWHFIRLGRFLERACGLSTLLDAYFSTAAGTDDLDWVALLTSCSAFEAYCKVYTADLKPEAVAEFLLLNPDFPFTVRHSTEQMHNTLHALANIASARKTSTIERMVGKLQSSLAYTQIDEIMPRDLHPFFTDVIGQCHRLHAAIHELYFEYPIESMFEV